MIKSVTVTNYLGESITLELANPEESGFAVQKIDGIGPVKANINTTSSATTDGASYNSARTNSRNIVMSLKFLFKPTIEEVRQQSYKYFPVKKQIKLLFETDTRSCEIYGYVEANEPDIFSSFQTTQISIVCPDPYFYSVGKTTTIFSGVESSFEFEFENDSLVDKTLEFGNILNLTMQNIYYSGDSEIGVVITMHAFGDATNITIYNTDTYELMKIDTAKLLTLTGSGVIAGDDIIISTVQGDKYIKLLRHGVYTNILNCLDKNVDWFHLVKGDNVFTYTAETGVNNLHFMIENQTIYEGV